MILKRFNLLKAEAYNQTKHFKYVFYFGPERFLLCVLELIAIIQLKSICGKMRAFSRCESHHICEFLGRDLSQFTLMANLYFGNNYLGGCHSVPARLF